MANPTKFGFDFQLKGAEFLSTRAHAVLADQVGVGKSGTAIIACDLVGAKNILVLSPGIARPNMVEEFHAFQTTDRTVEANETTTSVPKSDVVVTSYSLIRRIKVLAPLMERKWDVIIADEAHLLKNPVARQTCCAYGNKCTGEFGLVSRADRVWLLSGTLIPNDPSELWSHCAALFHDVTQGRSYTKWVDRYCQKAQDSDKIIGKNPENEKELIQLIKPHILRRTKAQVLPDLPPLIWNQTYVTPDKLPKMPEEIAEVERVLQGAIAKLEHDKSEEGRAAIAAVDKMHIATYRKWTAIAKAPAVVDYLKMELDGGLEKVVVFAHHSEVIEYLRDNLPDSVALYGKTPLGLRQRYIDGFRGRLPDFNPRVFIANLEIASTALTLTSASSVVFAESSWVPKDMEQAAARCHRNGQTRPVLARIFSLKGTVDAMIERALVRKIKTIQSFNDAITDTQA
jgi:SWI/SNF-related matrix-associated actin-dependent regulator 1 of chromatin subfamily A